ncbi:MAG: acetyl-CoA carboxylase biotin carboxyl carrier protein subunit [Acidobacteria bacterium]|nr:acetyl-CoA carboxylase biotin carboxyl carrier protein subunit [Acidobacteriota bacterium]
MKFEIDVGGRTRRVEVRGQEVLVDDRAFRVDAAKAGQVWSLLLGSADIEGDGQPAPRDHGVPGRSYEVSIIERQSDDLAVHVNGLEIPVRLARREAVRHGAGAGPQSSGRTAGASTGTGTGTQRVVAPMPGRVAKVLVKVGDVVAARQGLVVVEAMKMENELRSPVAGVVVEVAVAEGALVQANAVLIVVSG